MRRKKRVSTGRHLAIILLVWLTPWLQGCAQGELEQLVADIKKYYLNGGFTNISEPTEPLVTEGVESLEKLGGTPAQNTGSSSAAKQEARAAQTP